VQRQVNAVGESPTQGGVGTAWELPGRWKGDHTIEAPGTEARLSGRVSERTGRNASEAWAGLERNNASAESPHRRRRPPRSTGQPTHEGRPARRGMGRSTYAHAMTCNTGDLRGLPLRQRLFGRRVAQESQGPIRPRNPGNAGGGKGPWFGVRSNEPRQGDWREPGNS